MKINIIFATQSGTTEYVAKEMQEKLTSMGHTVHLFNVYGADGQDHLSGYDTILLGAPTYQFGKLESSMEEFLKKLQPNPEVFNQLKIAVFGLGSSIYPKFCTAAEIMEEWVKKNNGKVTVPTLKIDGFPDDLTSILNWVESFVKA